MRFSLSAVATALGVPPPAEASLSGVAVDSRKARPGDLFVAMPGARADGHDFARQAGMTLHTRRIAQPDRDVHASRFARAVAAQKPQQPAFTEPE